MFKRLFDRWFPVTYPYMTDRGLVVKAASAADACRQGKVHWPDWRESSDGLTAEELSGGLFLVAKRLKLPKGRINTHGYTGIVPNGRCGKNLIGTVVSHGNAFRVYAEPHLHMPSISDTDDINTVFGPGYHLEAVK